MLILALAPIRGPLAAPPAGYYDSVSAGSAAALRASLHAVIDDHQRYPYTSTATDTWDILEQADENPADSAAILDVYMNASFTKWGGGGGGYNREHTWPSSYGFPSDGSQNYPYTDCHHLFLSEEGYNSSRSNKLYAQCNASCAERTTVANDGAGGGSGVYPGQSNWTTTGIWETWAGRRGDVARALFYLDTRYEGGSHGVTGAAEPDLILTDDPGLVATSGTNASVAYMGLLSVLLAWHAEDPVDAREELRNDVVGSFQGNRNPFIDHPEWVGCVFAGACGGGGVPAPPSGLQVVSATGPVELDWSDNFEPDLAGYRVKRGLAAGGPYVALQLGLLGASTFSDAFAKTGWTYYYVVSAEDADGDESTPSSEVAVTVGALPWINEFHYDNSGADADEGVEIAGLAGIDLTGWQVVTYNGSGGSVTSSLPLGGTLPDDGSGFGFLFFPLAGMQNGSPDGLALVDPGGSVVEFLSYEGVFVAVGGPADGLLSSDLGVSESGTTAVGDSLQRTGPGSSAADFTWAPAGPHTRGAVNAGQTLAVAIGLPLLSPVALSLWAGLLAASGAWMARGVLSDRRRR
ncbi:MAG: endonuclease [Myxococcota bacterium]|nr:endonuclease [Myxococcota bacterium]